jgi:DNA-binding transcriptional LysR family regulator
MDANPSDAPRWDDLQLLVAVVDQRSFLAAGRVLGLATSTLSRRLAALELQLGRKLLERRHDGVKLTDAGAAVAQAARELQNGLAARLRKLPGGDGVLGGTVRLSSSEGFTAVLVPPLVEFARLHSGVTVELAVESQLADVAGGQADLALRTTRTQEPSLVYQQVGVLQMGLFATADYLREHGTPRSMAALPGHDFVGFSGDLGRMGLMQSLRRLGAARFRFLTDHFRSYAAAVHAHAGIGAMPLVDCAGLERILPRTIVSEVRVYLCWRRDARDLPQVQHLRRLVIERLRAELP